MSAFKHDSLGADDWFVRVKCGAGRGEERIVSCLSLGKGVCVQATAVAVSLYATISQA